MQSHHLEMTNLIPCHCWGLFFFFFFFAAPQSERVWSWLVHPAKFLSDWGTSGEYILPAFAIWRAATPNVCTQSFIFCVFCGAIGTGDNIWLPVWLTGSWHIWVQDTKTLNLLNNTPPSRLSPSSLLWLHFQSFLCNLMPCKVDPYNKCTTIT